MPIFVLSLDPIKIGWEVYIALAGINRRPSFVFPLKIPAYNGTVCIWTNVERDYQNQWKTSWLDKLRDCLHTQFRSWKESFSQNFLPHKLAYSMTVFVQDDILVDRFRGWGQLTKRIILHGQELLELVESAYSFVRSSSISMYKRTQDFGSELSHGRRAAAVASKHGNFINSRRPLLIANL